MFIRACVSDKEQKYNNIQLVKANIYACSLILTGFQPGDSIKSKIDLNYCPSKYFNGKHCIFNIVKYNTFTGNGCADGIPGYPGKTSGMVSKYPRSVGCKSRHRMEKIHAFKCLSLIFIPF